MRRLLINFCMKTGYADLPLHTGKAPRWLFSRMKKLATAIVEVILEEFGKDEFIKRISDPNWYQALGNLLGFDWHSSGLTTVTGGALKEAISLAGKDDGLFSAGGKGKVALKTPDEILKKANKFGFNPFPIIKASRLSAKVDSSCIQDGYSLYYHLIVFTDRGKWSVVEQGLNEKTHRARRYHWLSDSIKNEFSNQPHTGIKAQRVEKDVLDLTSKKSLKNKDGIINLITEDRKELESALKKLILPSKHRIGYEDLKFKNIKKTIPLLYEKKIEKFDELLEIKGIGAKTLRALSMVSAIIYGAEPSFEDPALFSYAHGGKDGTPYPVNRKVYDVSIELFEKAIKRAKIGRREELVKLRKLKTLFEEV